MSISIIIPIHKNEQVSYVVKTLDGIERTIGKQKHTVTFVGVAPAGLFFAIKGAQKVNFIPSDAPAGEARNIGARYAIMHHKPDVLVFLDAHMNFYDAESKDWGCIIADYILKHPDHMVSPAMSVYDNPSQRGIGLIDTLSKDCTSLSGGWWYPKEKDWGSLKTVEVPRLNGPFMAMSPKLFEDTLVGFIPYFGIEDGEICIRSWLLGKTIIGMPGLTVGHRFASAYPPFTMQKSIEWGASMLLYAFLNLGDDVMHCLYRNDLALSQNKPESLKMATTFYWQQVRERLLKNHVRTPEQYFRRFAYI